MGVYVLQGELLGATHTEPLFPERELGLLRRFLGATHTIPIYTDEGCWFSITKHLPPSQLDKPAPTLTVVFSLLLPWKYPTELVGEEEQDGDLGRFEAVEPEV